MGFINLAEKTVHAKLVYYGIGAGGKTTSLQAVHGIMCPSNEVNLVSIKTEQDATLLFDFLPINLGTVEGYSIVIQGFTVPGQPKYKRMRKYVLQGADAVVLVVDSQRSRLEENVEALESLLENLRGNGIDPDSIPIVVQYNKRDLSDIMSEEEMRPHFLLRDDMQAFPSVATDDQGVYETFVHATGQIVESKIEQYNLGKGEVNAKTVAEGAEKKLWSIFDLWREQKEAAAGKEPVVAVHVEEEETPASPAPVAESGPSTSRPAPKASSFFGKSRGKPAAPAAPASSTPAEAAPTSPETKSHSVPPTTQRSGPSRVSRFPSRPVTGRQEPKVGAGGSETGSAKNTKASMPRLSRRTPPETPPSSTDGGEGGQQSPSVEEWSFRAELEETLGATPEETKAQETGRLASPPASQDDSIEPADNASERTSESESTLAKPQAGSPVGSGTEVPTSGAGPTEAVERTESSEPRADEPVDAEAESAGAAPASDAGAGLELFSDDDLNFDLGSVAAETEETAVPSTDAEGEASGLLDMALQSNLQMAEAFGDLDRLKAALKRKNEELVKVTQNTIHDLNKPLSAVKIMLTSVVSGLFGETSPRIGAAIETSMAAVQMMERLIGDLTDSIALDTGREMKFADVDLGVLLSDVLSTLRPNIEEGDVAVRIEPMPMIRADEWGLTKAFMNLIGNAIQYRAPERESLITVSYASEGMTHVVKIADNGIGMPEEEQENLFQRFQRGSNVSGVSGTGLGLHIIKEVVLGHGGAVDVQSKLGEGTTFLVSLPHDPVPVPQSDITPVVGV